MHLKANSQKLHLNFNRPSCFKIMNQNCQNIVLINKFKNRLAHLIFMIFLSSWGIYYKMHIIFFKKVLII